MSVKVYVVRRKTPDGMAIVSAWTDVYFAKYEADRWEYDTKTPYDYVEGSLTLKEGEDAVVAHTEVATNVP